MSDLKTKLECSTVAKFQLVSKLQRTQNNSGWVGEDGSVLTSLLYPSFSSCDPGSVCTWHVLPGPVP